MSLNSLDDLGDARIRLLNLLQQTFALPLSMSLMKRVHILMAEALHFVTYFQSYIHFSSLLVGIGGSGIIIDSEGTVLTPACAGFSLDSRSKVSFLHYSFDFKNNQLLKVFWRDV